MRFIQILGKIGTINLFILIQAVLLVHTGLDNFANDPGVGWHLETGRWVTQHHRAPTIDPFLFSDTPKPWISDQWLSDLVFYLFFQYGGWPWLYAILILIYLVTFFGVLYKSGIEQNGQHLLPLLLVSVFSFKMAQIHFILRPVLLSFLLFAVVYVTCHKLYKSKRITKISFWLLPLVFALWANMHASFTLGLMLLLILTASAIGEKASFKRSCVLLFTVCALSTLLNPYGFKLHTQILSSAQSPFITNFHEEWRKINLRSTEGILFGISIFILAFGLLIFGRKALRWKFFELFTLSLFAYLSFKMVRFLPYFAIVSFLPLIDCFSALLRSPMIARNPYLDLSRHFFMRQEIREKTTWGPYLTLGICGLFILGSLVFCKRLPFFEGTYGPSPSLYPYQAVDFLKSKTSDKKSLTVLSPSDWGGFIVMRSEGSLKPVLDDRNELVGEDRYRDFFRYLVPNEDWRTYLRKSGAQYLLLPKKHPMVPYLSESTELPRVSNDTIASAYEII